MNLQQQKLFHCLRRRTRQLIVSNLQQQKLFHCLRLLTCIENGRNLQQQKLFHCLRLKLSKKFTGASTTVEIVSLSQTYCPINPLLHIYNSRNCFIVLDIIGEYECQLESEPRARLILSHLCSFESEPPKHRSSNNPDGRSPHSYQGHRI